MRSIFKYKVANMKNIGLQYCNEVKHYAKTGQMVKKLNEEHEHDKIVVIYFFFNT